MPGRRGANDPQRKERILDAAIEVIAENGVHGTTHRRIAAEAGLPLGSLTYHFDSLEQILVGAFDRLAASTSRRYEEALAASTDTAQASAAVADLICSTEFPTPRELAVLYEMYSYASHDVSVADLARSWLQASLDLLGPHFGPQAAEAIDSLVEGWVIHRTFVGRPLDRELVRGAVQAIADRFPQDGA